MPHDTCANCGEHIPYGEGSERAGCPEHRAKFCTHECFVQHCIEHHGETREQLEGRMRMKIERVPVKDDGPDLDHMLAGPELDRLVRRIVFDDKPDCVWVKFVNETFQRCIACGGRWDRGLEPRSCSGVAPYSTSAAAAAIVMEKLRISVVPDDEGWSAFVGDPSDRSWSVAPTMPHAVARAGVKAKRTA